MAVIGQAGRSVVSEGNAGIDGRWIVSREHKANFKKYLPLNRKWQFSQCAALQRSPQHLNEKADDRQRKRCRHLNAWPTLVIDWPVK